MRDSTEHTTVVQCEVCPWSELIAIVGHKKIGTEAHRNHYRMHHPDVNYGPSAEERKATSDRLAAEKAARDERREARQARQAEAARRSAAWYARTAERKATRAEEDRARDERRAARQARQATDAERAEARRAAPRPKRVRPPNTPEQKARAKELKAMRPPAPRPTRSKRSPEDYAAWLAQKAERAAMDEEQREAQRKLERNARVRARRAVLKAKGTS